MHKIIIALTLSLSLAGCVTNSDGTVTIFPVVKNPVTPLSLYDIKSTYAIAAAGADSYIQRYRDGHRCTKTNLESATNICSRRSIVLKLQNADRIAQIAIGRADAFIRDNPTIDATSVISAAQSAVAAFFQIQNGAQS